MAIHLDLFEHVSGDGLQLRPVLHALALQGELYVLFHRQPGKQLVEVLKHHDPVGAGADDGSVVDQYAALEALETRDAPKQRGLAAARWPEDAQELALLNLKAQVVDDGLLAAVVVVGLRQPLYLQ